MATEDEPTPIRARTTISSAIAQARASLHNPSRPFTPADTGRHLFNDGGAPATNVPSALGSHGLGGGGGLARPGSSYVISASQFASRAPAGRLPLRGVAHQERSTPPLYPTQSQPPPQQVRPPSIDRLALDSRARQPSCGGSAGADVLILDASDLTAAFDADQLAAWVRVDDALDALVDRPSAALAERLDREVAGACALVDARQRRAQRARVLDRIAPLMEARESCLLLRLCNVVLNVCTPSDADGAGADGGRESGASTPTSAARGGESGPPTPLSSSRGATPLVAACKLLFRLSKRESNDDELRAHGSLDALIALLRAALGCRAPPDEALIYALGTLKNASSACAPNATHLAQHGAIELLARTLRDDAPADAAVGAPAVAAESRSQLRVQATALLRNIAVSAAHRRQLIAQGVVTDLCALLEEASVAAPNLPPRPGRPGRTAPAAPPRAPRMASGELCLNVFRTLAKLTLHEDARAAINAAADRHLGAMVRALGAHRRDEQLVVRCCFVLGNLTASNGPNRERVGLAFGGCELLLELLAHWAQLATAPPCSSDPRPDATLDLQLVAEDGDGARADGDAKCGGGGSGSALDVLIKLIRLLAHLAMAADVGRALASRAECGWLVHLLEALSVESAEELCLNTASAITNLSFYSATDPQRAQRPAASAAQPPAGLLAEPERLVRALMPLLMTSNAEAITEAARALGNCSRERAVRDAIIATRTHEALLLLLGHSSDAVLLAVCGVLINLAADPAHRVALDAHDALGTLAELLSGSLADAGMPAVLVAMACKIVYNLSLPGPSARRLAAAPRAELLGALAAYAAGAAAAPADGGDDASERAEAAQVAVVLHRALSAQPAAAARDDGAYESELEPLAAPGDDDVELGDEDGLWRIGTHRPAHMSHDVACG